MCIRDSASAVKITTFLESQGLSVQPLLHTDIQKKQLKDLRTLIIPAGDTRIIHETLGKQRHQALFEFITSGGQFVAISTDRYAAGNSDDLLHQSQESARQFPQGLRGIARTRGQGEIVLVENDLRPAAGENRDGQFLLDLLRGQKKR